MAHQGIKSVGGAVSACATVLPKVGCVRGCNIYICMYMYSGLADCLVCVRRCTNRLCTYSKRVPLS